MKKIYQTPDTQEIALHYQQMLAASTLELISDDAQQIVGDDEVLVREWDFDIIDD